MTITSSSTLVKSIIKDGCLYQMEYKGIQNNLLYVILKLYDLGVSDQKLRSVSRCIINSMDALFTPKIFKLSVPLNINDWSDHLGDKDMYSSYLEFFNRQVMNYGVQDTLNQYFYGTMLAQSIGSQCLPMAHLALGLKYSLPKVIAQALSYIATSYQDTSFLLEEPEILCNNGYLTAHEILVDQVRVDPRFDLFSSKLTYRKILKIGRELLRTYVYLWRVPHNVEIALNDLRDLAARILLASINKDQQQQDKTNLSLSSNLLKSINSVAILYPNNTCPISLIRVQFLNVISSYILQGRPTMTSSVMQQYEMDKPIKRHVQDILINDDINPTTLSVLTALEEAETKDEKNDIYKKVTSSIYLQ